MNPPQMFTVPALVLEVGGEREPSVTLRMPPPMGTVEVPCKREMATVIAAHLYRWIDVTFDGGKVLTISPRKENP